MTTILGIIALGAVIAAVSSLTRRTLNKVAPR